MYPRVCYFLPDDMGLSQVLPGWLQFAPFIFRYEVFCKMILNVLRGS